MFRFLFLTLFISCSSLQDSAPPTLLDKIIASKQLIVGTTFDYAPFTYLDSNNSPQGSDIEKAKKLAHSLNVDLVFVKTTWSNLISDLKLEKFHIAMGGISKNLTRQQIGFFSNPYMNNGKIPISRCEEKDRFSTLKKIDQKSHTIVVNPGGTNYSYTQKHIKNAKIMLHNDNNTIFEKIISKKVNLMITDMVEVYYQTSKYPGVLCATMKKPLTQGKLAYLLPRDIVWKEYVDAWLDEEN